ncbi:Metallopeptidase, catalytic domain protein [Metarhizium guizhouense ARSEF 977]|uniref:Metallopeptidase, catalytic domain protein n=1 Tax=Metarhizium guizhouense (strain ARSEF 977) TaxID=1276136 RepID=A0A0B4GWN4_METGA|nr:Metallopeptidase, catalytic domain protein [Metarhizium guizhouense ARSEF 977]
MGHTLAQVVLTLAAVSALSIPHRPPAEPMTLPTIFERSEPDEGCLLKRSEFYDYDNEGGGLRDSCRPYQKEIDEAFTKCSERAENIINALEGKDFPSKDKSVQETEQPKQDGKETLQKLLEDWFDIGINNTEKITELKEKYKSLKKECDKKEKTRIGIHCEKCRQTILGEAFQGTGPIRLCESAFRTNRKRTNIQDTDLGGILMHEMSHAIGNTSDKGYGVATCKRLRTGAAMQNADTFILAAQAATSGDDTDSSGKGGKVPEDLYPPGGRVPDTPGGRVPDPPGGRVPDPSGGKDPDPSGGRVPDPPGGRVPDPSGGRVPDPSGGKVPDPSGGRVPDPPGGRVPDPSGGKVPDPSGGKVPDPSGGKVPDHSGKQFPGSPGGKSQGPSEGESPPHDTSNPNLPLTSNPPGIISNGTNSSLSGQFYPPKNSSSSGDASSPRAVSSSGGFSSGQAATASRDFSQVASHPEADSLPKIPHNKGSSAPSNGDPPAVMV